MRRVWYELKKLRNIEKFRTKLNKDNHSNNINNKWAKINKGGKRIRKKKERRKIMRWLKERKLILRR